MQIEKFEEGIKDLFEAGKLNCPVHLSGGNLDKLESIFKLISKDDYVFSTWRSHAHYLFHTDNWKGLIDEICGLESGICKGKARSMHIIDHKHHFYSSAIVAGMVAIAAGVALALKRKKSKRKVFVFVGDGGCDEGHFWEALRYAQGKDLPILFIVENNNRSVCTNVKNRWGSRDNWMKRLKKEPKVCYYEFKAKFPHCGTGRWINLGKRVI